MIIKKKNNKLIFKTAGLLSLGIIILFFLDIKVANAGLIEDLGNTIEQKIFLAMAWIAYGIMYCIGLLFIFLNDFLIKVAQYNDFVNVETVRVGWKIVRDFCNMFFILALLIIAFATILKYENYHVKKLLPKLVIMAVLINFSKTICGLFIDFSQVIMLTFVQGFAGNGGNNLTQLLGMHKVISMAEKVDGSPVDIQTLPLFAGLLVAIMAALVAVVIVLAFLAILIIRVVLLWVYVILSPIAFLAYAIPGGGKYSSQWWSEFSRQLVVGPVLAFFLWLALFTAQKTAEGIDDKLQAQAILDPSSTAAASSFQSTLVSDLLVEGTFNTFIITLGLLIGGLIVTQQAGGAAASVAGNALGKIKGGAGWMRKKATGAAIGAGRSSLAIAKGADAMLFKGRGGDTLQTIKDRKASAGSAAAIGAGIGSAILPGIGTIVGASAGLILGSKAGNKFSSMIDKKKQLRKDRMSGEFTENGVTYKAHESGHFLRYDKNKDKYLDADGNEAEAENAQKHGKIKPMGDRYKNFLAGYYSVKSPAEAAKNAALDEKISKLESNYKSFDTGTLHRMMEIEKDSAKKMAIAMTLAIKNGFKEASQVNDAKKFMSNPITKGRFNDSMNKRNMILNNTLADGKTLDEGGIAKLVSEGKANWKDQDASKMTPDAFRLMQKQTGVNFEKSIEGMIKTSDRDKVHVEKTLHAAIDGGKQNGVVDKNDHSLRLAHLKLTGGDTQHYENDFATLQKDIKGMSAADYANFKLETVQDPTSKFSEAFEKSMDISKLKNIYKSDKIDSELKDAYMKLAARNEELFEKMRDVPDFKEYTSRPR